MNRSILSLSLIIFIVCMCAMAIHAQVLNESAEFRVNSWSNITQEYHFSAMDDNGNFVIVWQSNEQDGSGQGIYAQRYSASGTSLGNEFRVNTYTNSNQVHPAVAMDDDGDFVVTWRSYGQDGSGWGIYAQHYTATGAPAGGEFRVNTYTASDQVDPTVDMDGNGNFVIAWISPQDGSLNGIYAQRYDASGLPIGGEFLVNTYTSQDQYEPSIAMNDNGRFVVAWESYYGQDVSGCGIYAQRYDASGTPEGSEFRVNTYTDSDQESPSVAMDDSGNFVIAWQSLGQDGSDLGIFGQRYTASGIPLEGEFQVNTSANFTQNNPSVAMDNDGDFIITWRSYTQMGSGLGIYAQRYDGTGSKVASEFRVNTNVYSYQNWPIVAMSENGHIVISWGNSMQQTTGWGIYAKLYSLTQEPTSTPTPIPPSPTFTFTSTPPSTVVVTFDQKIIPSDIITDDLFGHAVAIDGNTAVVSALYGDGLVTESGTAYVFERINSEWKQTAILTASDGAYYDRFGFSVAIDGDLVLIGAPYDDDAANQSGSAYVYKKPSNGWTSMTETAKLVPSDGNQGFDFGTAVAVDGNTIVVGTGGTYDIGPKMGTVYIFEEPINSWQGYLTETTKLRASDTKPNDHFGTSVSLSGNTLLVGTQAVDSQGRGVAYIFEKSSNGWVAITEKAKLIASDGSVSDAFGSSASIDGDTVVVGAPGVYNSNTNFGAFYVFVKPDSGWSTMTETTKLVDLDGRDSIAIGGRVSLNNDMIVTGLSAFLFKKPDSGWMSTHYEMQKVTDPSSFDQRQLKGAVSISGNTFIVGVESENSSGANSGAAYFFDIKPIINDPTPLSTNTPTYTPTPLPKLNATFIQKIVPPDIKAGNQFGRAVAIDGDTAVVGADIGDGRVVGSGSAYVYERRSGIWVQVAKLYSSDGEYFDRFGISVAIHGETIVIGAIYNDDGGSASGSAYVFVKPSSGWANMTETAKLLSSDLENNDNFGGVAVFNNVIVVGSAADDDKGFDSGSAYVFVRPQSGWQGTLRETAKLTASDGRAMDRFARNVAIYENTIVVGAESGDNGGNGSAYIFEMPSTGWATMHETAKLTASDGMPIDVFGWYVDIGQNTVVVGAPGDDEGANDTGSIYLFKKPSTGWKSMTETAKLIVSNPLNTGTIGTRLSIDQEIVISGGAVYIYTKPEGGWTGQIPESQKVTNPNSITNDQLRGGAVSISGNSFIVGVATDTENGVDSGSIYFFDIEFIENTPTPEPTNTPTYTPTNTPTPIPPSPTSTYTYTPIPTTQPTPIPTPDPCCEEIITEILTNRGLNKSASDIILGKLDNLLVDTTQIHEDILATNHLIHSASHTLLNEIQAGRTEIGMASDSLHDELDLLQRQLTGSTEALSASIGSIQIPPLLKEDLIREINENEDKIDAASRNLDIRIGDLNQSMQTGHQDLLDAINMNRMRIESASAAILAELQNLPWDKVDKKLNAVSVDVQAQSSEIQLASGILNAKVDDLFTSVESGNGSILTKLTDTELGIQENIDAVQNSLLAQVSQSATDVLDALDSFELPVDIVVDAIRENRAVIDNATAYLDNRVIQVEGQLRTATIALASDISTAESSLQTTLAQTGDLIEQARVDVIQKVDDLTPVLSGIADAINENETLIDAGADRTLAQLQNQAERIESATEYIELLVEDLRDEINSSEDAVLTELDVAEQGIKDTIDIQSDRLSNQIDQSTLSILDAVGDLQTPIQSIMPEVNENQAKIAEATEYLEARVQQVGSELESARLQLQDLQNKTRLLLEQVAANGEMIGSASESLSDQIKKLLHDQNVIGSLILGLIQEVEQTGIDADQVNAKADQIINLLDSSKKREIEDHLANNEILVQLFMLRDDGGVLEDVAELVKARIELVESKGVSARNAWTNYNNGVAQFNAGKYYDAFLSFSSAYRELTKVPK